MSEAFDPYHSWLGIPPREQPADYYRLLGIAPFESNSDVIENAADRQMAHLRTHQAGKYSELSQRLLNEVATAKVCLLSPKRKAVYDEKLRKKRKRPPKLPVLSLDSSASRPNLPAAAQSTVERTQEGEANTVALAGLYRKVDADSPKSLGMGRRKHRAKIVLSAAGLLLVAGTIGWTFLPDRHPIAESLKSDAGDVVNPPADQPSVEPAKEPSEKVPDESRPDVLLQEALPDEEPARDDPQTDPPQDPSDESKQPAAQGITETDPPPELKPEPEPDAEPPAVAEKKHPLPSRDTQQAILAQVDATYNLGQKRSARQRLQLAAELLSMGLESQDNMGERFVLLRKAMELARDNGDVPLMFKAIDAIAVDHDVDVLSVKASTLVLFAAKESVAARIAAFMKASGEVIDQALLVDRYDIVSKLADAAVGLAEKPGGANFREAARTRQANLRPLGERYQRFQNALTAIQTSADDANAHLEIGRWYCFRKGDWDQGIPHLAQGSDPPLEALAKQELAPRPGDAKDLMNLADAWWNLAEGSSGEEHDAMMLRAGFWYEAAQTVGLVSLARIRAEKRLVQIAELRAAIAQTSVGTPIAATRPAIDDRLTGSLLKDAWGQIERGDGETARQTLTAAAKANPDDLRVHFSLGLLEALDAHDWLSAQKHFTKCVRLQPTHVPSLNNLALVNIRLKGTSKAMQNWRAALDASPEPPGEILRNLARLQHLAKNDRIALSTTFTRSLGKLCETAIAGGASLPATGASDGWSFMSLEAGGASGAEPAGETFGWSHAAKYADRWCVTCNGFAQLQCSYRRCARGTVQAYRMEVVGVNPITGSKIVRRVPIRVRCSNCGGRGWVACPQCNGGRSN